MLVKKVLVAGVLGLMLASGSVQASDPTLDATSREALMESSQEILKDVSRDEQVLFLTAVDVVSINHALAVHKESYGEQKGQERDLSQLSDEEGDEVIERTREALNGKTLQEVIDMASAPEYLEARMTVAMLSEQMKAKQQMQENPPVTPEGSVTR